MFLFNKSIEKINFNNFRDDIEKVLRLYDMKLITYDISFEDNASNGKIYIEYLSIKNND